MGPSPAVAAVRLAVRRSLASLPPGERVLVACSGGSDSLALAAAAAFEAPRGGLRAGGLTVDHALQAGSSQHALAVAAQLRGLGLEPVEVLTVSVGTSGGPEAAARAARYAALDSAATRLGAVAVLLGHSRDDQAETVLLGLARGSGARSLAGMAPVSGRYRRPLLDLPRSLLREACVVAGLVPWDDPHNADRTFARVRVRQLLPQLDEALGPGVPAALARTARLLRDDADALDLWAEQAARTCADPAGGVDALVLAALPAAVRGRVLLRAARDAGCPPSDLSAAHVAALDALVTGWHGQGPIELPGRVQARRDGSRLSFAEEAAR